MREGASFPRPILSSFLHHTHTHQQHALTDKKIKAIATGHSHSAAISESGELFMWGMKLYLEPQLFKCSPGEGQAPEKVAMVACGGSMTAAVAESGRLYTFGKVRPRVLTRAVTW